MLRRQHQGKRLPPPLGKTAPRRAPYLSPNGRGTARSSTAAGVRNLDHRTPETACAFLGILMWLAAGAAGSQGFLDLAFMPSASHKEQSLTGRFVAHAHPLIIGKVLDQRLRNLFRGPSSEKFVLHVVTQLAVHCQFTDLSSHPGRGGRLGSGSPAPVDIALGLPADRSKLASQIPGDGAYRLFLSQHVSELLALGR